MESPCGLTPQYAVYTTLDDVWRRRNKHLLGCAQVKEVPPPLAPTDLRTIALPENWQTMTQFELTKGNTEHIPRLPASLLHLTIKSNKLKNLPLLPQGLQTLDVEKNALLKILPLPASLTHLQLKHNNLEILEGPLPTTLRRFAVTHNNLTTLPSFENTQVTSVGLGFNTLTALPAFPSTLLHLGCSDNQLTEIRDLPHNLEVLNCKNNPLRSLQIDHLRNLNVLIASNCDLTELPLLPPEIEGAEDGRQYFFDDNPLTGNFSTIYEKYKTAFEDQVQEWGGVWHRRRAGSTREFREAIEAEHKRLLAERKATTAALIGVKRSSGADTLRGNYGPMNLISQFITGKQGTLEAQRLALLENQEEMGVVPSGTAKKARERVANIAIRKGSQAERAKLYIDEQNLEKAKYRQEENTRTIEQFNKSLATILSLYESMKQKVANYLEENTARNQLFPDEAKKVDAVILKLMKVFQDSSIYIYSGELNQYNAILRELIGLIKANDPLRSYASLCIESSLFRELIGVVTEIEKHLSKHPGMHKNTYPQYFDSKKFDRFLYDYMADILAIQNIIAPDKWVESNGNYSDFEDIFLYPFTSKIKQIALKLRPYTEYNINNEGEEELAAADALAAALAEEEDENNENNENNNEELNNSENNNQEGGQRKRKVRKHRTPRKQKGKRQTRRH